MKIIDRIIEMELDDELIIELGIINLFCTEFENIADNDTMYLIRLLTSLLILNIDRYKNDKGSTNVFSMYRNFLDLNIYYQEFIDEVKEKILWFNGDRVKIKRSLEIMNQSMEKIKYIIELARLTIFKGDF